MLKTPTAPLYDACEATVKWRGRLGTALNFAFFATEDRF